MIDYLIIDHTGKNCNHKTQKHWKNKHLSTVLKPHPASPPLPLPVCVHVDEVQSLQASSYFLKVLLLQCIYPMAGGLQPSLHMAPPQPIQTPPCVLLPLSWDSYNLRLTVHLSP